MSEKKPCWFTNEPSAWSLDFNTDLLFVDSEACGGVYAFTQHLMSELGDGHNPNPANQSKINCARRNLEIRKENKKAIPCWTIRSNVENLKKFLSVSRDEHGKPPKVICALEDYLEESIDHSEKPYLLLQSFAQKLSTSGAFSKFTVKLNDRVWARAVDREELLELILFLESEKLLALDKPSGIRGFSELSEHVHSFYVKMTVQGWEAVRKKYTGVLSNKVFIATQFKWPVDNDIRVQAVDAIKKACRALGYEADIVEQNHTENITDRIISEIKNSRFMIAELTYNNRGVYYEAGYARGMGIPVFHVVKEGFTRGNDIEGQKIHFDIEQIMYREWANPNDLEGKLKDWIEATLGKYSK